MKKKSDIAHYNAILIEDLRSEFKIVTEAVIGTRESLETKIESVKQDLEVKIDDLRTELKMEIGDLRENVEELSEKIDTVMVRVERHEEDISFLKRSSHF
jgi:archaellum component FlaC